MSEIDALNSVVAAIVDILNWVVTAIYLPLVSAVLLQVRLISLGLTRIKPSLEHSVRGLTTSSLKVSFLLFTELVKNARILFPITLDFFLHLADFIFQVRKRLFVPVV